MGPVRNKAIDIANALLDDGYVEGRAIAIGTAKAEGRKSKNRRFPDPRKRFFKTRQKYVSLRLNCGIEVISQASLPLFFIIKINYSIHGKLVFR